jgi:hypothetical protein
MLYLSLALDPLKESVLITGIGDSKEDCEQHATRTDYLYQRSFGLDSEMPIQLHGWLKKCGLPESEARRIIRGVGDAMLEVLDKSRWTD